MQDIIGGEFRIQISKQFFSENNSINLFSSGRGAFSAILEYIFFTKNRKERILLPDYLCSTITQVCIDKNIPYIFYHIEDNMLPDELDLFDKINCKDIVLLISYFGIISTELIAKRIKSKYPDIIIIQDDVQNYYSHNNFWDYRFNSYRKWFSVPDGAEVFSVSDNISVPQKNNEFAQYKFSGNVLKNFYNLIDNKIYLGLIEKGEAILDKQYDCKCSEISQMLIPQIQHEYIKERRKQNAFYLHEKLEKMGVKHLYKSDSIPLFVPLFLGNRENVRKKMFSNNIFTPVHWPYESPEKNGKNKNPLYENELSLICDQRYSLYDMQKQINILEKCI